MKLSITLPILLLATATTLSACKDDDEKAAASAPCTMEELQAKSVTLAEKLQSNPAAAQDIMGEMQELGTKVQQIASSGEMDEAKMGEICVAYDNLIEKM